MELHLGKISESDPASYDLLFDFFEKARAKAACAKRLATAELIAWLRILGMTGFHTATSAQRRELLERNLSFLVKTEDDLDAAKELLERTQTAL